LLEEDARLLGIKLPELEEPEEVDFILMKCNAPIVEAFLMLNDRAWQFTGMGELIGLDYKAADVIWNRSGIKLTPDQFRLLMLFEQTVTTELRKRKKSYDSPNRVRHHHPFRWQRPG
jgi:hypothetical protein